MLSILKPLLQRERSFFDQRFYLKNNFDVAEAGVDPFEHFMTHGWREGRDPAQDFNILFYIYSNCDGQLAINPLTHYIRIGRRQRVKTAPSNLVEELEFQRTVIGTAFDPEFYRRSYSDVPPESDPLLHLIQKLQAGDVRDPTPHFSTKDYLAAHPFLRRSNLHPLVHFLLLRHKNPIIAAVSSAPVSYVDARDHGRAKVLEVLEPAFDQEYYFCKNPDVRTARYSALDHYIDFGWREGRNPTPFFWTRYYLDRNPDIARANVNPFYHYLRWGKAEGRRPNPIGPTRWPAPRVPSDAEWVGVPSRADPAGVIVILPVYSGYDDTLAAIGAALSSETKLAFQLLVINDASPNPQLTERLRYLANLGLFSYLENRENLGFVGTVNRGLKLAGESDVILLNADTCVFGDWISRLRQHAYARPNIATVTPFSNNATIVSYPDVNDNNEIALELSPQQLDEAARHSGAGRSTEVPTGVGFCMFIANRALATVGLLDEEAFGRGYGEENDFCMRARKAGFVNLHAHDVFVFHTGKVSFAEFGDEQLSQGVSAVALKHPEYSGLVKRYIAADPARGARRRLDSFRLTRRVGRGAAVFISHSLGGGIETHVRKLVSRLVSADVPTMLLSIDRQNTYLLNISLRGAEDIYRPNLTRIDLREPTELRDLLAWLEPGLIHLHSTAGLPDSLLASLFDALIAAEAPLFYTAHDFGSVCGRNNFVRADGVYCGRSGSHDCTGCSGDGYPFDLNRRKAEFARFLSEAVTFAPSRDTARRLSSFFPNARILVRPHESEPVFRTNARQFGETWPRRIAILGAIGQHKGSGLLLAAAIDAQHRSLPLEFRVIGYSDISEDLSRKGVMETGPYRSEEEASGFLEEFRPHAILFPSIWPETYCYALSQAFNFGAPPVVLDIGALPERVRDARFGHVLDYALAYDPARLNDELLKLPLEQTDEIFSIPGFHYPNILGDYYEMESDFVAKRIASLVSP